MGNSYIDLLNHRLGERLGFVCGGSKPRFAWKWAPDQPWFVYDRDDRTLLRKSWADAPSPAGEKVGRAWVLAECRPNKTVDHHGYGEGIRIPAVFDMAYKPYFETALPNGELPTERLNQNYIWWLDQQLEATIPNLLAEEKYEDDQREKAAAEAWNEAAYAMFDENTGAFGNCEPGARSGYMSLPSRQSEILPGCGFEAF